MAKLRVGGCVRCQGVTSLERDLYGRYEYCLQCGCIRDLPVSPERAVAAKKMS